MGCTSSSEAAAATSNPPPTKPSPKTNVKETKTTTDGSSPTRISSQSTPESNNHHHGVEHSQTETTKATCSTTLQDHGNFRIRYACLSKRGQDADSTISKPNQDAYVVHHKFCDVERDSFFAVFDGHGPQGEKCSAFVQERLPTIMCDKIQQYDNLILTTDEIQASLHEAHTQCNDELHASSHIDDTSSGTTAISVYMQGDHSRITICNVGDSRAVLGTRTSTSSGSTLRAVPLSTDHTPRSLKEAQRCVDAGARILTFGQIMPHEDDDSDIEDPPRVWAQNGHWPGTAFTRSIGDSHAETLGVFAEPEMLSLKLSEKEKIIVLCSDGIFDVMSNQEVIDKCFQYYYEKDPARACHAVVEHSHNEWLISEECLDGVGASFDDMTIACIFVYNDDDLLACANAKSSSNNNATAEASSDGAGTTNTVETDGQPRPRRKRARQKTLRNLDEM